MMSDETLIPAEIVNQLPQKYSQADFEAISTSGKYLARLQLMTSNSKQCKDGTFPINHFALIKDNLYKDLGSTVDVLIVAWRPKALRLDEPVISIFDPQDPQFKQIAEDSEEQNSKCMYGPEYLVWIPVVTQFALFFMGSKSARRESANMNARLLKAGTLKPKKIETKQRTWFCPTATPCTTPFDLPSADDIKQEKEKFDNPPKSLVEEADDTGDDTKEDRAR